MPNAANGLKTASPTREVSEIVDGLSPLKEAFHGDPRRPLSRGEIDFMDGCDAILQIVIPELLRIREITEPLRKDAELLLLRHNLEMATHDLEGRRLQERLLQSLETSDVTDGHIESEVF